MGCRRLDKTWPPQAQRPCSSGTPYLLPKQQSGQPTTVVLAKKR
jgi:hypothetical protein